MTLLDEVLAANAGVRTGGEVPVPALGAGRVLVVVTCSEARGAAQGDFSALVGLAAQDVFVVANAGARVHDPQGDVVRSVACALAAHGGGEVMVVAHEDCEFLGADPESLAALTGGGPSALNAAEEICGDSFVSARQLSLAAADVLRGSGLLPAGTPVHALTIDPARGVLGVERAGYGLSGGAGPAAPAGFLSPASPILGSPGTPFSLGAQGPVAPPPTFGSPLMGAPPPPLLAAAPPPPVAPAPFLAVAELLSFTGPSPPIAAPAVGSGPSLGRTPAAPDPVPTVARGAVSPPAPPSPPSVPPAPGTDDPFRRASEILDRLRKERRKSS